MTGENKDSSDREAIVRAQVLSLARQLLAGKLSVIAAARGLSALRCDFDPDLQTELRTFVGIDSETDDLPIGEVRKYWSREALERKDREIAECERIFRDNAIEAAIELIRLLEVPS